MKYINAKKEVWMPHAGHLCVGRQCQFHLNTYVNGYIVSTVGEYVPDAPVRRIMRESRGRRLDLKGDEERAEFGFEEIGDQRLYETMVFRGGPDDKWQCCPYVATDWSELEMEGYMTATDAYQGHLKYVAKYRNKKEGHHDDRD